MTCVSDSIQDFDKIKCSLRELDEYSCMESEKKRFGRYHRSCFWDVPKKKLGRWSQDRLRFVLRC